MANQSQELGMQIRGVFADVVELIPQKARVALYVSAVALAVVALAAQSVVAIWWPEVQHQVDATVAEIIPWELVEIGCLGTAHTQAPCVYADCAAAVTGVSCRLMA